ncbi:MAG: hypothetical protein LBS88_00830 [Tannerellaceae bacterium]|jgi:hypothetical protein|nr:hypothetical protein [Tannerellaceae bacterium]
MRKLIAIHILLLSALCVHGQVFIGTEPTGNPVLLEVKSSNRGVLIPRINIPDTQSASPVNNPPKGLMVMNIYPGKEGLFFWNGGEWEKLKTKESVMADLLKMGKKGVFIGIEESVGQILTAHQFTDIELKASFGTLTNDKHIIQEKGVYELTASFTGIPSERDGFIALSIYNYKKNAHLAFTTVSQTDSYKDIAAKAIYYGPLEKDDEIGLRIFYGTTDTSKPEKVETAILSIKKIATD